VTDHAEIIPPVLPEILLLAEDSTPDGPSLLANGLWYKYRTSYKWAWIVWDNTVASLRQIPLLTSDPVNREAFALRYGAFLLQVDRHLPSGLDEQVLDWFLGTGRNEVAALSSDAWNVLTTVLVFLVINGAIKTTTILRGLVYPSWQLGTTAPSGQLGNSLEVFIFAANHLTKQLLLRGEEIAADISTLKLFDEQRLRTRLRDVYREPHFSLFASNIPTLVLVENNLAISDALRTSCRLLRRALCRNAGFHEGLNRNMNAVRDAFEQSLQPEDGNSYRNDCIVEALHWIWSDSDTSKYMSLISICCLKGFQAMFRAWTWALGLIYRQFSARGNCLPPPSNFNSFSGN
jgi:mediator of RNA polymerase II transcription subunit 12, fungi type